MDSAYMGDIMALLGRHEWKFNMIGTAQENRTGADTAEEKKLLSKNTYEAVMWQHMKLYPTIQVPNGTGRRDITHELRCS